MVIFYNHKDIGTYICCSVLVQVLRYNAEHLIRVNLASPGDACLTAIINCIMCYNRACVINDFFSSEQKNNYWLASDLNH